MVEMRKSFSNVLGERPRGRLKLNGRRMLNFGEIGCEGEDQSN